MPLFKPWIPDNWGTYVVRKSIKSLRQTSRIARNVANPTTFEFEVTRIRLYHHRLRAYLNTPAGPLWRKLERRAELAQKMAKAQVGVDTGRLKSSIYKRHLGNATGQYIVIGSDLNYALMHHEGTRPHVIMASSSKNLKFVKNGKKIFTPMVRHPGTQPNRYLTRQLSIFKPKIVIY